MNKEKQAAKSQRLPFASSTQKGVEGSFMPRNL